MAYGPAQLCREVHVNHVLFHGVAVFGFTKQDFIRASHYWIVIFLLPVTFPNQILPSA
jgi:hypothetical protein